MLKFAPLLLGWLWGSTHLQLTEAGAVLVPRRLALQIDGEPSPHCEFSRAGIHGNGRKKEEPVRLSHNDDHLPFAGGPEDGDEETELLWFFFFLLPFFNVLFYYLFVPLSIRWPVLNAAVVVF